MLSLKFSVHFTLRACHNSDTNFSLEILDLYLDFIKLTVEKVDLHAQVVPNILRHTWVSVSHL